jgi:hypothetical protein
MYTHKQYHHSKSINNNQYWLPSHIINALEHQKSSFSRFMLGLPTLHNIPQEALSYLMQPPFQSKNNDMRLWDCITEHIKKEGKTRQEIKNGRL